jgi:hypothetical protein
MLGKLNLLLENIGAPLFYRTVKRRYSDEKSRANLSANKEHDITGKLIRQQNTGEIEAFHYGECSAKHSGCAPISIYNALTLLGKDPSFAKVISQAEGRAGLALKGKAGTNPYGIGKVLDEYGLKYSRYSSLSELESRMKVGDVAVMAVWNNREDIRGGAHFFAIDRKEDGYHGYNGPVAQAATLPQVLGKANLITSYLITG